jgi:hypothetical protein
LFVAVLQWPIRANVDVAPLLKHAATGNAFEMSSGGSIAAVRAAMAVIGYKLNAIIDRKLVYRRRVLERDEFDIFAVCDNLG